MMQDFVGLSFAQFIFYHCTTDGFVVPFQLHGNMLVVQWFRCLEHEADQVIAQIVSKSVGL